MQALLLSEPGATPELGEVGAPEPGPGELRVGVHAASVNGFDLAVISGFLAEYFEHRYPVVLGKDFAGEVDAVGPDAGDWSVGDRVFGVVTKPFVGDGSFAEQVTVPTAVGVTRLPDHVDFTEGAALGLAGSAALACLDGAALRPGQTLLVSGATGGVGNQVVQRAAAAGARVVATAATDAERALVTGLGAHETVDHAADLAGEVRRLAPDGADVVMHLAGDPQTLLSLVRDGGRYVSTLIVSPDQVPTDRVTVVPIYANPEPAVLDRLADGSTRVVIQDTFALSNAGDALAAFLAGTLGKLVITTR